jgi:Arc/MetJ family transcription regulator
MVSRTVIDVDDEMLAKAQEQLGTSTKRDTINRALALAAAITVNERAQLRSWLQENAEFYIDFEYLAERERQGE